MPKNNILATLFVGIFWVSCTNPAQKFTTETAQLDTIRSQINTMKVWFMVDEHKISKRYKHLTQQDSIIQLTNLSEQLPKDLGLSIEEFRAIPNIYRNYLNLFKQQQRQLDSLTQSTDSLQNLLYSESIGRRKFRKLLEIHKQCTNNLQLEVEATVKKTIEVEPTYKRIQPHIDSLEQSAIKLGQ
jgi:hypothetical protein